MPGRSPSRPMRCWIASRPALALKSDSRTPFPARWAYRPAAAWPVSARSKASTRLGGSPRWFQTAPRCAWSRSAPVSVAPPTSAPVRYRRLYDHRYPPDRSRPGLFSGQNLGGRSGPSVWRSPWTRGGPAAVSVLPPAALESLAGRFDLIVNIDSWTELSPETVQGYWDFARRSADAVLSINHEENGAERALALRKRPSPIGDPISVLDEAWVYRRDNPVLAAC